MTRWGKRGLDPATSFPPPVFTEQGTAGYLSVLKQHEPQQMQMHVLGAKGEERDRRRGGETAGGTFTAVLKMNTCCRDPGTGGTGGQSVNGLIILMFDVSV